MQNDDLKKEVGSKIKIARNVKGWTQDELANNAKNGFANKKNGITKTVISNIENGKSKPNN